MAFFTPATAPIELRAIARGGIAAPEQAKPTPLASLGQTDTTDKSSAKPLPDRLVVEKDQHAGRFVQTLIDSQTLEVKHRYPSEAQLAFSRAVGAYVRAMSDS